MKLRTKIPAGALSATQYLAFDAIAGEFANSTLRITTRQTIQFHGVIKGRLKKTIKSITITETDTPAAPPTTSTTSTTAAPTTVAPTSVAPTTTGG